jgi:hypothetical protein
MKTNNQLKPIIAMRIMQLAILIMSISHTLYSQEQVKPTVAILNIDSKGINQDPTSMSYLFRLELEKTGKYNVMDKYDVADIVKKNGIDLNSCYGKTCVVEAGRLLSTDKMLTGSIERFGEKIVISIKLIDVQAATIEKSNTTEYLNLQQEIQKMVEISIKKMLEIETNPQMVDLLISYDVPVSSPKTQLKLNGPRMGIAYTTGDAAQRLQDSKDKGGFDMYPATFQFGYQQEVQYMSAGNFQALFEFIPMISGLESGSFIPSLTILNGFRMSKNGWEIAFGPSFRVIQKANGFYDTDGLIGNNGNWYLEKDMEKVYKADSSQYYPIISRLDSRGKHSLSTSLVLAAGKTFRSGYLNIPVNIFVSPRKEGWTFGASFGFNVQKKSRENIY